MRFAIYIFVLVFSVQPCSVLAQKFGYIDSEFILSKMPEYKKAQKEIEQLSKAWQSEVEKMYKEINALYADLQAEEVLLSPEMRMERLTEIRKKEDEVTEYQKRVFGHDGLFFLKKKELIKPVQDLVFEAVERVAKKNRLQFVFDKSGELVMIYTDPIHDYTDYVLEELGLLDENDLIKD
jgi:outer membrane protein